MFIVSFAKVMFFIWYIFGFNACLAEFYGPCLRVMHFEYTVSDLNYTNIISLIKENISSPLKISRPITSK